jgi:phospholipid-binding lipoprotein MlaA
METNSKTLTIIAIVVIWLTGCASNRYVTNKDDPFEPMNRGFYKFNKTADALYVKPISKFYEKLLPSALRKLISNFFNNVNEVPTIANSVLQGKGKQASDSLARLTINTTLGIGGLFDVAKLANIERHKEDLGQTLAIWGYKNSSYIVLPIFGPSTIRDGIGLVGNAFLSPPYYLKPKWRNRYEASYFVNRRVELQETESLVTTVGVDEYSLVRNSYLQHRGYVIADEPEQMPTDMLEEPPQ